jgi:hypothetical protein
MIFAFFEEIDGPPGRARCSGTGGGNRLLFGSCPRAGTKPGRRRPANRAAGGPFRCPPASPHDAKTELDRRRTNAGGPRATGAGWRRNDGSCARQAARLTGGVGAGRHDSDGEPPLFGPFSGPARRAPGAKGRTRGQRSLRRYAGAPDTIRTCDLCLRRATLYPAELRVPQRFT